MTVLHCCARRIEKRSSDLIIKRLLVIFIRTVYTIIDAKITRRGVGSEAKSLESSFVSSFSPVLRLVISEFCQLYFFNLSRF